MLLHALDRASAGEPGSYAPFRRMGETLTRRGIVVLLSDFYAEPPAVLRAMNDLRQRGHDVLAFHILDPAELEFPFERASSFRDLESGEEIPVVPDKLRDEYRSLIRGHTSALESLFSANRMDYAVLDTSRPLDQALFRYLSTRQRLSRTR